MLSKSKAVNRFYRSEAWKQARLQKIVAANGRCEKCGGVGVDVHHIIHITPENVTDPDITLNPKNLILLCKDCHNAEHERFKKGNAPKFDSEGNLIPY
ncbi:MAG: HNH endonuclease [Bacilli bacterium]|jgi:5-methylcytosine-specific restriction endonuclease McrA|nr:HNH endonuclease [Bacilli bacterium]